MTLSPFATSSACVLFWAYVKATFAPSRASAWTIARPMPRLPPVTIATLPENIEEILLRNWTEAVSCLARKRGRRNQRPPGQGEGHEQRRRFRRHHGFAGRVGRRSG